VNIVSACLVVIGTALAAWAASGPFLFTSDVHWSVTPTKQLVSFAAQACWIPVMVLSYRRDAHAPMWKLVLLSMVLAGTWVLGYIQNEWLWMISDTLNRGVATAVFIHIVLSFPSGRLPDRFDRRLVAALYILTVPVAVISNLFWNLQWTDCTGFCPANPILVWPNDDIYQLFTDLNYLAPIFAVAVLFELWRHWRDAGPARRRTLRPLIVSVPLSFAILVPWYVAQAIDRDDIRQFLLNPLFNLPSFIIPLGFLLGLLRARLARGSIASLAVELGRGVPLGGLEPLLARTLRDPTLRLAFPDPTGDGLVASDGTPFVLPDPNDPRRTVTRVSTSAETLAVLVHDPQIDAEDPGLVEAVLAVAGLAIENERLAAQVRAQLEEVRASRQRIVEAGDAERRRIERDLHDGAQQRLVALAIRLDAARAANASASDLIDSTTSELGSAIAEVRQLARGIHPTILTEAGLRAAVESLAERAPIPVSVDVPDRRFAPNVEATAYYVISEALTNVARYSQAKSARVVVREDSGTLIVRVEDDGRGGAQAGSGSGLRGLLDRVAAAGGSFSVESPAGVGTTVAAELPLQFEPA
jgi:signal transduction histidine kinase